MWLTILYWVLIGAMLVGIIGNLLPGIPGTGLILIALLIWEIATKFSDFDWLLLIVFIVLLLSTGVDLLATYWGTKQVGASKWGQIGAIIGLTLGFLGLLPMLSFGGPLLGVLFGSVLGAFIGEFLYRRDLALAERSSLAAKVSIAVVVSSLVGNLIKTLLAIAAVIIFVLSTYPPINV